jgi:lipoprotein-anchoring transpeptidase ErfK/SrfK
MSSSLRSRASSTAVTLLALLAFTPGARAADPMSFPAAGELNQASVTVRATPSGAARRVSVLTEFRPDFRRRVVLALAVRADRRIAGREWYRVTVPGRPNGRTGWVPASAVTLRPTRSLIVVRRSARRLELFHDGRLRLRTPAAVGAPGMETPLGLFHVAARFRPANPFLGVFALETSAYSRLSDWPGGGVVGIHGTNQPWSLGRAVSHGCVRVSNAAARVLEATAPVGTPIRIVR